VGAHYLGNQQYDVEPIGIADDLSPADGIEILDYWQAQDKGRARMGVRVLNGAGKTRPLSVRDAIEDYLQFLENNRKSAQETRYKAAALILPELGDFEVASLTREQARWHSPFSCATPHKARGKATLSRACWRR
jgi:hypothetical protein